jgi:DNA-binding response OmpR family regulator
MPWCATTVVRLLVVDDDAGVVQTFAHMLRLEGYEVLTALDAATALRAAEAFHPDALLLDLRMPHIDGVALLRELRQHADQRATPVAIVTGDYFVDDTTLRELQELGAQMYYKPLWFADLIKIIQQLLPAPR